MTAHNAQQFKIRAVPDFRHFILRTGSDEFVIRRHADCVDVLIVRNGGMRYCQSVFLADISRVDFPQLEAGILAPANDETQACSAERHRADRARVRVSMENARDAERRLDHFPYSDGVVLHKKNK